MMIKLLIKTKTLRLSLSKTPRSRYKTKMMVKKELVPRTIKKEVTRVTYKMDKERKLIKNWTLKCKKFSSKEEAR